MRASPELTQAAARTRRHRCTATREQLLEAALALFSEHGFSATRAEDIAHRAGVSKGTLFLHYPSKAALFDAVVRAGVAQCGGCWGPQQIDPTVPIDHGYLLRQAMEQWWDRVGSPQGSAIAKLVVIEARNFPMLASLYQRQVIAPGMTEIRFLLARGMASGQFRTTDLDQAALNLLTTLFFLVVGRLASVASCQEIDPGRFLSVQLDLFLHGLAPNPSGHDSIEQSGQIGTNSNILFKFSI